MGVSSERVSSEGAGAPGGRGIRAFKAPGGERRARCMKGGVGPTGKARMRRKRFFRPVEFCRFAAVDGRRRRADGMIPFSYLKRIAVLREKTSFVFLHSVSQPFGIGRKSRSGPKRSLWRGKWRGGTEDLLPRRRGRHGERGPGEEKRSGAAGAERRMKKPIRAGSGGGSAGALLGRRRREKGWLSYFPAASASRMRHTPHTSVEVG